MTSRAEELDAEAALLTAKAAALRGVADNVARGNEGEVQIGQRLEALREAGWHVLHDRRKSARSPANLDHVVVGPGGVLVVDAKNWSGGLLKTDERGMKLGGWRKDDELLSVRNDASLVEGLARAVVPEASCAGVLAFVQAVGLSSPAFHHGVVLLEQGQLLPWILSLPRRLTDEQVRDVAGHLEQALPPRAFVKPSGGARPSRARAGTQPRPRAAAARKPSAPGQRTAARTALREGSVKLGILAAVVFTLPVTLPVLSEHVFTPLAERMSSSIVDSTTEPAPR